MDSAPAAPLNTETKVLTAAEAADQAVALFSPAAAAAIQAGIAAEPVFSAFVKLIIGIFQKHPAATPAAS